MTVDRVEKLSDEAEEAEYCRADMRATEMAAFGNVRAEVEGRRLATVLALLAKVPAVDRRASIFENGVARG